MKPKSVALMLLLVASILAALYFGLWEMAIGMVAGSVFSFALWYLQEGRATWYEGAGINAKGPGEGG